MKNKKQGFILVPLSLAVSFFILGIFLFVGSKEKALLESNRSLVESTLTNVNLVEGELRTSIEQGKKITNSNLTQLGKELYDDGTINEFNVLEQTIGTNQEDIAGQVQFLDRVITERRRNLERVGKEAPDKSNNVFELDLVSFLDKNDTRVNNITNLTLNFGTNTSNTPNMYVLIGRVKKNDTIVLDEDFEEDLARREAGTFTAWASTSFAFDYRKVNGYSGSCTVNDNDTGINWCRTYPINDFISNQPFDLNNYFYKVFLVFGTTPTNNQGVPFKVTASNGVFGIGNLTYGDLTVVTPNNAKRRFIIETSEKNSTLPYLVYNLWVKGQLNLRNDGS